MPSACRAGGRRARPAGSKPLARGPARQTAGSFGLGWARINNARILRADDLIGSLEPGKLADFVVLDRDPPACHVERTPVEGGLQNHV